MSSGPVPIDTRVRNTARALVVPESMSTLRIALPLIRALVLAAVVIMLIMFGLPQLLAAAAAAS